MYVWQYLQYFISSKNNWNICKTMYFKAKSYIDKELLLFFSYFYVCIFLCEELTKEKLITLAERMTFF